MVISRWQCIIDAKNWSIIYGSSIILISFFVEMRYKVVNLLVLYFLANSNLLLIIGYYTYHYEDKLVSYYAKKHKQVIDFYNFLEKISQKK